MDSLIDTFHIDWHLIIAQMINFAVVIFVLYRFAIKPLSKLMDERSAKIALGLSDAKRHKELLSETENEYKKIIAEAKKESQEIVSLAKKDAEKIRESLIEKASDDARKIIDNGKVELDREKEKIISDAKNELANMVVLGTEKILNEVMDEKLKSKVSESATKHFKS